MNIVITEGMEYNNSNVGMNTINVVNQARSS